jgi:hypothetical protein
MLRIWLEVAHHTAFRIGGWAFVRAQADGLTGQAGGERRLDAERTALLALLAALKGLQGPATLATASPLVAAIPARIAAFEAGEPAPAENLDLWAQATTALKAVRIVRAPANPFCAGWAELARDRAKDKGSFSAPIPKANLAKAGVA